MTKSEMQQKLRSNGLEGRVWGRVGPEELRPLVDYIGTALPQDMEAFVVGVGNATVGPFNIVLAGSDDGSFSALTESRNLPPEMAPALKVMEHAGESYVYLPLEGRLFAYDSNALSKGNETLHFASFSAFLEWIFKEARAALDDSWAD
ncbi:hypothetical protein [Actomonas aquatica]|uniref:Knr4/Smi1-like domain-containing protein n=1 Tax=Actomonas aquatica TaxID=2866162 RepID=A0ABZ1C2C8_9BACT|nr:hypothetical protein [Opitutus sp. WL0086]WRQ85720.1 hypothetical protein K1X11_012980 [Opitutus sp. WL0086]